MSNADQTHLRLQGESRPLPFVLTPDSEARAKLAADLGILGVRKLRFEGIVAPDGARDWRLDGTLGATVVQSCVVTLEPVTTRVETDVVRRFMKDVPEPEAGSEVEMTADETIEPLPATLDLVTVMSEALALALPDFPRADGVDPVEISVTEPGKTAMTDDDAKPFAGLASLKETLEKKGDDEG